MRAKILASLSLIAFALLCMALWPVVNSTGSAPTVSSLVISPQTINLTENSTTEITFSGSIIDSDGCDDVALNGDLSGVFYRSDKDENCSAHDTNCYPFNRFSCSHSDCEGSSDASFSYSCSVDIAHFASSTTDGDYADEEWVVYLEATDGSLNEGTAETTTELNTLLALTLDSSIDYGFLDLGTTSATQSVNIQNTGNSGIDVNLSVDGDMICDGEGTENIPAANVHVSTESDFTWDEGTELSTTTTEFELDIPVQTHPSVAQTSTLYLSLKVPEDGIRGYCQNTLTITAKADDENGW